jgi:hypothetical protein
VDYDAEGEPGFPMEYSNAGITIHKAEGKAAGRHVGISIPETSNEELLARRRAARKAKPGTVRAVNKRGK